MAYLSPLSWACLILFFLFLGALVVWLLVGTDNDPHNSD